MPGLCLLRRHCVTSRMPRRGLEPPRDFTPTSTSSWRVCQFRHLGCEPIAGRATSVYRRQIAVRAVAARQCAAPRPLIARLHTADSHGRSMARPTRFASTRSSISIQGESTWAGCPCVFVRLTGCHLRCTYCDTEYAFHEGAHAARSTTSSPKCAAPTASWSRSPAASRCCRSACTAHDALCAIARQDRAHRNLRRVRHQSVRSARHPHHGPQDARQRRGRAQPVVEHRASHAARRGEVRHHRSRRLRLGGGSHSPSTIWPSASRRC